MSAFPKVASVVAGCASAFMSASAYTMSDKFLLGASVATGAYLGQKLGATAAIYSVANLPHSVSTGGAKATALGLYTACAIAGGIAGHSVATSFIGPSEHSAKSHIIETSSVNDNTIKTANNQPFKLIAR